MRERRLHVRSAFFKRIELFDFTILKRALDQLWAVHGSRPDDTRTDELIAIYCFNQGERKKRKTGKREKAFLP